MFVTYKSDMYLRISRQLEAMKRHAVDAKCNNIKDIVIYFKHILLFNKKQLDRTQVSQLISRQLEAGRRSESYIYNCFWFFSCHH
jgi:hypothetical protein